MPDLGQSVTQCVTQCQFRILTQRVTFETSDLRHLITVMPDKKTKGRQKDKRNKKDQKQRPKKMIL